MREKNNVRAIGAEIVTRLDQLPDLSTQPVRSVRREFTKRLAKSEPEVLIEIGRQLLARSGFHYRFVAYELRLEESLKLSTDYTGSIVRLARLFSDYLRQYAEQ